MGANPWVLQQGAGRRPSAAPPPRASVSPLQGRPRAVPTPARPKRGFGVHTGGGEQQGAAVPGVAEASLGRRRHPLNIYRARAQAAKGNGSGAACRVGGGTQSTNPKTPGAGGTRLLGSLLGTPDGRVPEATPGSGGVGDRGAHSVPPPWVPTLGDAGGKSEKSGKTGKNPSPGNMGGGIYTGSFPPHSCGRTPVGPQLPPGAPPRLPLPRQNENGAKKNKFPPSPP